jgi:hypothetical protein
MRKARPMPNEDVHQLRLQLEFLKLEGLSYPFASFVESETTAYVIERKVAAQIVADADAHFEKALDRIEAWTPIKLREELVGDLREDVQHRRKQGWTEKRLQRLIWWQYGWAIAGAIWKHAADFAKLIGVFKILKLFTHRP